MSILRHTYQAGRWTATLTARSAEGDTVTKTISFTARGITLGGPPRVRYGRRATFRGSVVPAENRLEVTLLGSHGLRRTTKTRGDGTFSVTPRLFRPGIFSAGTSVVSTTGLHIESAFGSTRASRERSTCCAPRSSCRSSSTPLAAPPSCRSVSAYANCTMRRPTPPASTQARSGPSTTRCTSGAAMRFTATHPFRPTLRATDASASRCGWRRISTRPTRTARRSTSISATLAATLLLAACGGAGKPIPYRDISAKLHPVEFPRLVREIFRTRAAFAHYLAGRMPGRAPRLPPIDFSHREAILIASGPRSSTGYSLRVVSVRETSDRIAVTVHERTPALGEKVVARLTYPFRLITIPRSPKSLFLHFEGRP